MATSAVATQTQTDLSRTTPAPGSVRALLQSAEVLKRFEKVLGNPVKAAQFAAALSTLVYANKQLKECDANTIIAAAFQAAALDLAIDANLGQAHIVPYGKEARFQIGWKGYVQLALRTAQYAALNVEHVFEGEVEIVNRFTGEIKFGPAKSEKVVGVLAYLKLLNGFEKYDYWTLEKIEAHAKKFSKSYGNANPRVVANSGWTTNPEAMQKKTVLLDLLRKYGVLSVEMRQALSTEVTADAETGELTALTPEQRAHERAALFGADDDNEPTPGGATPAPTPTNPQTGELQVAEAELQGAPAAAAPGPQAPAEPAKTATLKFGRDDSQFQSLAAELIRRFPAFQTAEGKADLYRILSEAHAAGYPQVNPGNVEVVFEAIAKRAAAPAESQ